ncbi:hypothetical protein FQA39_LY00978 [Lamprigera yunnana]|nr:hypothetical protein FQA39_LY00978 [Lamprigera yunnana]
MEELDRVQKSTLWSNSNPQKGKYLIIIYTRHIVHEIFRILWSRGIINVAILVPSRRKQNMVYTSNPMSDSYYCRKTRRGLAISQQRCSEKLNKLVKSSIRDFGGCPLNFNIHTIKWNMEKKAIHFIMSIIEIYLNCTIHYDNNNVYNLQVGLNSNDYNLEITKVFFRTDWIWVTAAPVRVSHFETITSLFQKEVWILTGLIFLITIIAWWLIGVLPTASDRFSQFCHVFIEVTSLTVHGTVSLIPNMGTLRCIFLIYSCYAIILQTAFNTNLIRVLTIPHYSNKITSTKELIQMNTPLYITVLMFYKALPHKDKSTTAYTKLKKQLLITHNYSHSFDLIHNFRNTAIVMPTVDYYEMNEKREFNTFVDNFILGDIQLVFQLPKGISYFIDGINEVITILTESGIYKKEIEGLDLMKGKNKDAEQFVPLNLEHLYFVFALYVVGLLFAIFVFMSECCYSMYCKMKQRALECNKLKVPVKKRNQTFLKKLKEILKMKLAILYSSILTLALCINNLTLEDMDFNSCLLHLIQQIFKEHETLCFLTSENYKLPLRELTNPYVVVDIRKPILLESQNIRNFIILTKSTDTLMEELYILPRTALWSNPNPRKGTYLIITSTRSINAIFPILWLSGIINVVILVPSDDKRHMVYTSNPFSCGKTSMRKISEQICSEKLNMLVKRPMRDFGGCPINFNIHTIKWNMEKKAIHFIMSIIEIYLNCTIHYDNNNVYNIQVGLNGNNYHLEITKVFFRTDWTWVTAAPVRIFNFETIISLFQKEVWILTGLIFLITVMAWWLIGGLPTASDRFSQFCHIFIEVTSLTVHGTVNLIPNMRTLRCIFFIYSFYAIIIQTAFNTNLIHVLTLPHYSHEITSMKELIQMNMPLYINLLMYYTILPNEGKSTVEYVKLKKQLLIAHNYSHSFDFIYNFRNTAIVMPTVDYIEMNEKREFNTFVDNSILGDVQLVFQLHKIQYYFIDGINEVITILTESGIYKKEVEGLNFMKAKNKNTEEFVPLNLEHLYFVFALFIVGMLFAVFVFMLECCYSMYCKKKLRALECNKLKVTVKKRNKMFC